MRRRTLLVALPAVPLCRAQPSTKVRTKVEIASYKRISPTDYVVTADVENASSQSQLVLLLRTRERFGLHVATDNNNVPIQPITKSRLPPRSAISSFPSSSFGSVMRSIWNAKFYLSPRFGSVLEVYAIVCEVRERPEWTKDRDYRGLAYLPFGKTQNIEDALLILKDFGWNPTGYTRIAP